MPRSAATRQRSPVVVRLGYAALARARNPISRQYFVPRGNVLLWSGRAPEPRLARSRQSLAGPTARMELLGYLVRAGSDLAVSIE